MSRGVWQVIALLETERRAILGLLIGVACVQRESPACEPQASLNTRLDTTKRGASDIVGTGDILRVLNKANQVFYTVVVGDDFCQGQTVIRAMVKAEISLLSLLRREIRIAHNSAPIAKELKEARRSSVPAGMAFDDPSSRDISRKSDASAPQTTAVMYG